MKRLGLGSDAARRLLGCLAASVVLAMMWGPQEGSQTDYGYAFRQAVLTPRIFVFLILGVLAFLVITFWPKVVPYLTRAGVWPLVGGAVSVVAAHTLMHWYDPAGDAKFGTVAKAVANTNGLSPLTTAFFGWLWWAQLLVVVALGTTAIARRNSVLAWATAVVAALAGLLCYFAHHDVASIGNGIDHSLGVYVAVLGYLVIVVAAVFVALSKAQVAQGRVAVNRVLGWRPGFPLAVLGLLLGLLALGTATWFSPQNFNATLSDTHTLFLNTALAPLAVQFLIWLAWLLLVLSAVLAGVSTYYRMRIVGWTAAAVGVVSVLITLISVYDFTELAGSKSIDNATGAWQNLGAGPWMACAAFFLLGAAGYVAATAPNRDAARTASVAVSSDVVSSGRSASSSFLSAPGAVRSGILLVIAIALFYPPTATGFWQSVLVSEIGIYVLLAVGLNVVVGWAGLLDLGFIAFYAIGSYTTAYLVGSLPIKPPSWLQMSPLLAIPFAIAICLLAGLALGAPTLRLRGDYLAIVTLGFGEIIRIVAVNADPITNGSRGPSEQVPHPAVHLGPLHITWGLNQLQYWYLLLVLVVVVVILFRRLENSRIGRSWAAIREDEVAAQATGINTFQIKLLAFAIGASTSGLAGVFFASQVGFFNPDNFVLNNSILVVAYVVFGGMGSLPGAMAGAALLTWLPEFLKDQVPAADRQMWIGAVVLAMMIFRPGGVLPARRRAVELSGLNQQEIEGRDVPLAEGMATR